MGEEIVAATKRSAPSARKGAAAPKKLVRAAITTNTAQRSKKTATKPQNESKFLIKLLFALIVVGIVVIVAVPELRHGITSLFSEKEKPKEKEEKKEGNRRVCSNFNNGGCAASNSNYKRNSSSSGNSLLECCMKKTCEDVSCGKGRKKKPNSEGNTRHECCAEIISKKCSDFSCVAEFGKAWKRRTGVSEWTINKKECCLQKTCAEITCLAGRVKMGNAVGHEEDDCCRDKTCEEIDCSADGKVARAGATGSTSSECCAARVSCDSFDCTNYGSTWTNKTSTTLFTTLSLESCCRKRTCFDVDCGEGMTKKTNGTGSSELTCCEAKAAPPITPPPDPPFSYLTEGDCNKDSCTVERMCLMNPMCTAIGQQKNGCWHLLKGKRVLVPETLKVYSELIRPAEFSDPYRIRGDNFIKARMRIALWNLKHKRWIKMGGEDMQLSPPTNGPVLPSNWDSERFWLVPYEVRHGETEFALYNDKHRRYVRMPKRGASIDTTKRSRKLISMPNGLGWERFKFLNQCGGRYALKCSQTAGGVSFMRATSSNDVTASDGIYVEPPKNKQLLAEVSQEIFYVVQV
tara:strand:+ start:226 stop:1950 length:1725 start_codon:yes stop_codon:yes gene_type:complete